MLDQITIDQLRNAPIATGRLLIGSQWVDASEGATFQVTSPIDGTTLSHIAAGSARDVDSCCQGRPQGICLWCLEQIGI